MESRIFFFSNISHFCFQCALLLEPYFWFWKSFASFWAYAWSVYVMCSNCIYICEFLFKDWMIRILNPTTHFSVWHPKFQIKTLIHSYEHTPVSHFKLLLFLQYDIFICSGWMYLCAILCCVNVFIALLKQCITINSISMQCEKNSCDQCFNFLPSFQFIDFFYFKAEHHNPSNISWFSDFCHTLSCLHLFSNFSLWSK